MSLSTTARRAVLLSLFLLASVVAAAGPSTAARVSPPETGPAAPAPAAHPAVAVAAGPDVAMWTIIGVAALLVLTGLTLLAARYYRHSHRAATAA